jgi:hypothetical protein
VERVGVWVRWRLDRYQVKFMTRIMISKISVLKKIVIILTDICCRVPNPTLNLAPYLSNPIEPFIAVSTV